MSTQTIAHFINPFLPVTQNWMYNQLLWNTGFRPIVLCRTLENTGMFPLNGVYPAFPKNNLSSRISMLLSRACARYPQSFYRRIIDREKPVLLHGHFSWESWRNIHLVKATGLPLVTTFYGLDVNKLWQKPVWKKRYRILFDCGDLFTVEGHHMANALADIGCPQHKIHVVHLGVDTQKIPVAPGRQDNGSIGILFTGLSREKKGSLDAAQAFAHVAKSHPNIILHCIGNGPYLQQVHTILEQSNVLTQCIFHGYLSYDAYLSVLGISDIVLAPSVTGADGDTEGGAPVVVTEAQVAGIPVVGTVHCDIPDIVVHGKTGLLCEEHDWKTLAANLAQLVDDPVQRTAMGKAARLRAPELFSIQEQVRKLNTLYHSLL
jgi:colanic acid/amylovoran biosynthesis glycosyltransferase